MTVKEFFETTTEEEFRDYFIDKKQYYKKSNEFLGFVIEDFQELSYEFVNDIRDKINTTPLNEFIKFVTGCSDKEFLSASDSDFFYFFNWLVTEIEKTIKLEEHLGSLKSDYDTQDGVLVQAGVERLNKYGVFGVVDELSNGDLTKHDEILKRPYSYILTKLFRDKEKSIVQENVNGILKQPSK